MNFGQFLFYRLLSLVGQIMGVVAFILALLEFMPYDPTLFFLLSYRGPNREKELARIRHELGIDVPLYQQYFNFFNRLLNHQSFGRSWSKDADVSDLIVKALGYTIIPFGVAFIIYTPLAIVLGVVSAKYHRSVFDNTTRFITTATYSIPPYMIGIYLILLSKNSQYSYFPTPSPTGFIEIIKYSFFPIITVILIYTSFQYRLIRHQMMKIFRENYIRTARAKGLSERTIIFKHAMRNALPFIITSVAVTFPIAFSGIAILEIVFDIPGTGDLMVKSSLIFDWPILIAGAVIYTIINATVLLFTDMMNFLVSPKLRRYYIASYN